MYLRDQVGGQNSITIADLTDAELQCRSVGPRFLMGTTMKNILLASVSAVAILSTSFANAQTTDDSGATELPPLLVTAGRSPVDQEKSGHAFSVITGEQLEQNQTRYVADALRQVPGIHVNRTGSFGGLTQLRVRGAEGNHVLVLIDGVEVSAVGQGEFDFGGMQVTAIDRIEVLRGPQSAFWGSNATAGVVNIITKRGSRDGWQVEGLSEAGTDGTFLGGVSVYGGQDNFDAAFSINYRQIDGFNISDFGDERDGAEGVTLTGRVNVDVTENLAIDFSGRVVDRLDESDSQDFAFPNTPTQGLVLDTDDEREVQEFSGTLGATWTSLDGAWTHVARLGGNTDKTEMFTDGLISSGSKGDRLKGTLQSTYAFERPEFANALHSVTVGYEWERERFQQLEPVSDPSQLDTQERETNSFVAEYRGEFADQLYLNAAVRHDLNDAFEDSTTYSLAGAWAIPNTNTRLHASVGTGVTNPTFFEQFGFVPGRFDGNPGLVAEESFGWDIGIEQRFLGGDLIVGVTYFNQDLTNEIATDFSGLLPSPINQTGESERQGIEVSATAQLWDGFSATATYTYTDATDPDGEIEVRRPEQSASLNAAYTFFDDRARIFGEVIYNGEMDDLEFINATPETRVTLEDYVLVNVGGSYKFNDNFEAYGRVENLFDENFEEVFGFNTQGRTAFVGLKAKF